MVRATAMTCSDQVGFRFWGIVLLPTCPTPNFSSSSPISVRCINTTSWVIFARLPAIIESTVMNSTRLSRAECQVMTGFPSPRSSISASRTSVALSPSEDSVPAPPLNCPTRSLGSHCPIRSMCRLISAAHTATLYPNVIGNAC